MTPSAFASKFYGLFTHDGRAIQPFEPSLYNAGNETGVDIRGRPFGDWFLYQVGVLNGANENFGDSNNAKDWYILGRLDYAKSDLFSASFSGFAYFGSNNAKVSTRDDVNWNRYGVGANVRYRMVDFYGAFVIDRVTNLPPAIAEDFDATATGLTVEADVILTDRLLLSVRFDQMNAGGLHSQRTSNALLGFQAKYYLRSNIAVFARDNVNLTGAQGGTKPARNFRNGVFVGADFAF